MGPDHSQLEIYHESKHGVLFNDQKDSMNLAASPKTLTTADMPVPTCATCHLSGLNGQGVTHNTTERLSWLLYVPIWLAVVAAAFGLAFLGVATWSFQNRRFLKICGWVMAGQVLVDLIGAGFHLRAISAGPSESLLSNAIHTAPLFAPMIFADLAAILGGIGLWCSWSTAPPATSIASS